VHVLRRRRVVLANNRNQPGRHDAGATGRAPLRSNGGPGMEHGWRRNAVWCLRSSRQPFETPQVTSGRSVFGSRQIGPRV
jgi:hypothetical protein